MGGAALVGLLTSGEEDALFCTEETIVAGTETLGDGDPLGEGDL